MATYICLTNWTTDGIKHVKDSPRRLEMARKLAAKFGVEMPDFYLTMGAYDMVVRLEADSDEAVAKFVLALSTGGAVRTTTLKAFSEDTYRSIIDAI